MLLRARSRVLKSKATASAKKSTPEGWDNKGKLAGIASKVLMKVLWAARLARYDLLKAVSYLARFVTRWSTRCDEMLHRLVCYIDSTKHHRMVSWVGDSLTKINPHLFADADFAGDPLTQRCTSGYHLVARGPRTCFVISGQSKTQGCVSHSTPEAELVALSFAL